jgi:hypothetical protein
LGVLATDNIASLTNAHHRRPVFFNLQVESGQAEVSLAQGLVAGDPLGSP